MTAVLPWLAALALGLGLGAGIGYIAGRCALPPALRSIGAGLFALTVAAGSMAGVWYLELCLLENAMFGVGLEQRAPLWIAHGAMDWVPRSRCFTWLTWRPRRRRGGLAGSP